MAPPDRYEPLPDMAELPRWLWRRLGRRGRVATVVSVAVLAAAAAVLIPQARDAARQRAEAERRDEARALAARVRELRAAQRPRFARSGAVASPGAPAGARLAARREILDDVAAAIRADARSRVRAGTLRGPVDSVACEPFPRTVDGRGAEADLSRRRGRYLCVAVTAAFARDAVSVGGVLGHPYRAQADFATGRFAYCKTVGAPGPAREQLVTTPVACGGRPPA